MKVWHERRSLWIKKKVMICLLKFAQSHILNIGFLIGFSASIYKSYNTLYSPYHSETRTYTQELFWDYI